MRVFRKTRAFSFVLLLTISAVGYGQKRANNKVPIYKDTSYSFRERAADLVAHMTLEEELSQMKPFYSKAIPRLEVEAHFYGSVCQHGVQGMYASVYPGRINGGVHATSFPVNFAVTMTWDPQLMYEEGVAISDEARGFLDKSLFGVSQNNLGFSANDYGTLTYWAPDINLDRDPRWGRGDEAFGEDPYLASHIEAAYVEGIQGETMQGRLITKYLKVALTAKHYALYNVENNRTGISSNATTSAIRDYYTVPFHYLINKAHVAGIMTSYNAINGTPAIVDMFMDDVLLRRTFGFDGYSTSDCGAVAAIYNTFPNGHYWAPPGWRIATTAAHSTVWIHEESQDTLSAAAGSQAYALRAGTCLNCFGNEYTLSNMVSAIKAGVFSKGVLDHELTNLFTVRMKLGGFDPGGGISYTHITKSVIGSPAHRKLAKSVAENALVMLKDDSLSGKAPLLPLDPNKLRRVLILGDLADTVTLGGYSGNPYFQVDAVQGIRKVFKGINPNVRVTFDKTGTSTTSEDAVYLSEKIKRDIKLADAVIVFIGTNNKVASEFHDRASLAIPGNQEDLIDKVVQQGNKNMILVMQTDGPVNINFTRLYFPAILFSGYNGEAQGLALADVLTGKKNPSGHLDFTWYRDEYQLPDKENYHLIPGKTGGLGRTYWYFTGKPLFPFGYGLSYTAFKYANFTVSRTYISPDDSVMVSFDVTNTGEVPGASVPQLYVGSPNVSSAELPIRRLEGFVKTKVLKPGEIQHVSLKVKALALKFWDASVSKYVVYSGAYSFQLGKSADDIDASQDVIIQGNITQRVSLVTVEPEDLVFKVGGMLDLNGKNKWIEDDTKTNHSMPHLEADHIVEAVFNDGTFADPTNAHFAYRSSNTAVAEVSGNGIVKFVGAGVARITATIKGVSGSAVFVVK